MLQFLMQWCLDVHLLMVHLERSCIAHWYYTHYWNASRVVIWGVQTLATSTLHAAAVP